MRHTRELGSDNDQIAQDDITDREWKVIEHRAARRDLASDKEVEALFGRYRTA